MLAQELPHSRFVDSFKKQFREQEARLLRERARQPLGRGAAERVCLIAVDTDVGGLLGCLDVRSPWASRDGARSMRPVVTPGAEQALGGRLGLALASWRLAT